MNQVFPFTIIVGHDYGNFPVQVWAKDRFKAEGAGYLQYIKENTDLAEVNLRIDENEDDFEYADRLSQESGFGIVVAAVIKGHPSVWAS